MASRFPAAAALLALGIAAAVVPAHAAITLDDTKMVSVAVFGVTPQNTKTNGAKLLAAIAAVTDHTKPLYYAKTLYFPAGTYLFEKAVVAKEVRHPDDPQDCGSHQGRGTIVMVGATDGAERPLLKLKSGLSGWGNTDSPKTLLTIENPEKSGGAGGADCAFRNGLRGINIDVSGYAGAIGLHFDAAQDSFLEDVKVIATNAYRGITAVPGTMAAANIEVDGGQYGIHLIAGSLGASLVGVKLTNQTKQPLTTNVWRGISVAGLEIVADSTKVQNAITLGGSDRYQGHLSLYDAHIKFTGNGTPRVAIANPTNRTVALHNLYTDNARFIVNHGDGSDLPSSALANGLKQHLLRYVRAPRGLGGITGAYRIDNVTKLVSGSTPNDQPAVMGAATDPVPASLVSQHLWTLNDLAKPWRVTRAHTDADVVKPTFPDPPFDPAVDDTTLILQQAIDAAAANNQTLYLPAGTYAISSTIQLRAHTRLLGVPGLRSVLKPVNWTGSTPFMVQTDSDETATTLIQDMVLDAPRGSTSTLGALNWRAGPYSIVRRIRGAMGGAQYETHKIDFLIDGKGGGRWYSLANHLNVVPDPLPNNGIPENIDVPIDCRYRKLVIADTDGPVTFYGLNLERGGNKKRRVQYPFGEIRNAKNVRVFGQKMEIDGADTAATDNACNPPATNTRTDQPTDRGVAWDVDGLSENIFLAMTISNDVTTTAPMVRVAAPWTVSPVPPIALAGLFVPDEESGVPATASKLLRDEAVAPVVVIDRKKWLAVFKRGEVDHSRFKHVAP